MLFTTIAFKHHKVFGSVIVWMGKYETGWLCSHKERQWLRHKSQGANANKLNAQTDGKL